jgi:hypothetical protein
MSISDLMDSGSATNIKIFKFDGFIYFDEVFLQSEAGRVIH